jgi:heptosyltransferase I
VLAAGARYRLGWWRLRDGANIVSRPLPRRPESVHRVDWFLDTARALSIAEPSVRFPIAIPDDARARVSAKLAAAGHAWGRPYVVINQAAGNPPRRWSRSRYAELAAALAEQFGLTTVLIGTGTEAADCDAIVRQVCGALRTADSRAFAPISLAGETSLKEAAALLDECALHISGDTGSLHLAAALGTPVVAFFGSTDPAHAGPWGQQEHVLARRDICSTDCTVRRCALVENEDADGAAAQRDFAGEADETAGLQHPGARCLDAISVHDALAMVERALGRRGAASRCGHVG